MSKSPLPFTVYPGPENPAQVDAWRLQQKILAHEADKKPSQNLFRATKAFLGAPTGKPFVRERLISLVEEFAIFLGFKAFKGETWNKFYVDTVILRTAHQPPGCNYRLYHKVHRGRPVTFFRCYCPKCQLTIQSLCSKAYFKLKFLLKLSK